MSHCCVCGEPATVTLTASLPYIEYPGASCSSWLVSEHYCDEHNPEEGEPEQEDRRYDDED